VLKTEINIPETPEYYYQVYANDNNTPCPVADMITVEGIQDGIIDHRHRTNCCIGQGCMRKFALYMYEVNCRMAKQDKEWAQDPFVQEPGQREGLIMDAEAIARDFRFICKRGRTCGLVGPALKEEMEAQGSIDPTDPVYEAYRFCEEHGYPQGWAGDVKGADEQWAEDNENLPPLGKLFKCTPAAADFMRQRARDIFEPPEEE